MHDIKHSSTSHKLQQILAVIHHPKFGNIPEHLSVIRNERTLTMAKSFYKAGNTPSVLYDSNDAADIIYTLLKGKSVAYVVSTWQLTDAPMPSHENLYLFENMFSLGIEAENPNWKSFIGHTNEVTYLNFADINNPETIDLY